VLFKLPSWRRVSKRDEAASWGEQLEICDGVVIQASTTDKVSLRASFAVLEERRLKVTTLEEPSYQRQRYRKGNWAKLDVIRRNKADHQIILTNNSVLVT